MSTNMPQSELQKRALQWLSAARRDEPRKKISDLIDEAGMRFNLSPQDAVFLTRLLKEESESTNEPPSKN